MTRTRTLRSFGAALLLTSLAAACSGGARSGVQPAAANALASHDESRRHATLDTDPAEFTVVFHERFAGTALPGEFTVTFHTPDDGAVAERGVN